MNSSKIKFGLNYLDTDSFLHRLSGVSKFLLFVWWVSIILSSFDLRVLLFFLFTGLCLLKISRIPFRLYRPFLLFMFCMVTLNAFLIYLFSPLQGVAFMGQKTLLFTITPRYVVTLETLFYLLVIASKVLSIFPMALLFVFCTHPTEFAASLNRIGLPYRIAYTVSLTLRYLPEITKDFVNILHAQQARGVEISSKVPLMRRIKSVAHILFPLIISSLEKAEVIANAMSLRRFGTAKKRTWYNARPLGRNDYIVFVFIIVLTVLYVLIRSTLEGLFWYPF